MQSWAPVGHGCVDPDLPGLHASYSSSGLLSHGIRGSWKAFCCLHPAASPRHPWWPPAPGSSPSPKQLFPSPSSRERLRFWSQTPWVCVWAPAHCPCGNRISLSLDRLRWAENSPCLLGSEDSVRQPAWYWEHSPAHSRCSSSTSQVSPCKPSVPATLHSPAGVGTKVSARCRHPFHRGPQKKRAMSHQGHLSCSLTSWTSSLSSKCHQHVTGSVSLAQVDTHWECLHLSEGV